LEQVAKKLERLVEKMDQKSKELASLRTSLLTKTKVRTGISSLHGPPTILKLHITTDCHLFNLTLPLAHL
jgi:P2-related tail formation protein